MYLHETLLCLLYKQQYSTVHYVPMQVFWAYIVGMLTSLGKMKLDRIHSMLKMFALQGTGGKECSQVRSHLVYRQ